jgi:hypothetical protein
VAVAEVIPAHLRPVDVVERAVCFTQTKFYYLGEWEFR